MKAGLYTPFINLKESTEDIVREWNEMAQYEYAHNVKPAPLCVRLSDEIEAA